MSPEFWRPSGCRSDLEDAGEDAVGRRVLAHFGNDFGLDVEHRAEELKEFVDADRGLRKVDWLIRRLNCISPDSPASAPKQGETKLESETLFVGAAAGSIRWIDDLKANALQPAFLYGWVRAEVLHILHPYCT
jgi:hypothetical protein